MKNIFLLLLFAFLSVNYVNAQGIPPPPTDCETCQEMFDNDAITAEQLATCLQANNCSTGIPINSNIFFLFASAISLGGYFFYKSHKKNLH